MCGNGLSPVWPPECPQVPGRGSRTGCNPSSYPACPHTLPVAMGGQELLLLLPFPPRTAQQGRAPVGTLRVVPWMPGELGPVPAAPPCLGSPDLAFYGVAEGQEERGCVPHQTPTPRLILCFSPPRWTVAPAAAAPRAAVQPPRADPASLGRSSRALSTTRLGSSQGPSPVRAAELPEGSEGMLGATGLWIWGGCLSHTHFFPASRHFAPQLPGQQRAAAAGHRHHPADPQRPPQRHETLPGHAPVPDTAPLPDAVLLLLLFFLLLAACLSRPRHQNYLRAAAGGRRPHPAPRCPVPKPDPDVQAQW